MAPEEDAYEQSADQQIRCQIDKIRKAEGECRRLVEVQLDGRLLCVGHAGLLRLEECSETMLGEVFEMEQWLESVAGEADELHVRRAEHHRNDLLEQLRLNQTRIGLIHDVLLSPRRGQGADERRRGARPRLRPGDVPHLPAADRELGDGIMGNVVPAGRSVAQRLGGRRRLADPLAAGRAHLKADTP